MNKPRRYVIKEGGSAYNWSIVDTERQSFEVVATCGTLVDAQLVCNALNFNHRPSEYGYRVDYESYL